MAVYTFLDETQIEDFLSQYDIGTLISAKGIAEGVENSNYLITTQHQDAQSNYILTLFEKRVNPDDLPFFLGLMQHLAQKNIPCPQPILDQNNVMLKTLAGRKAVIVSFLNGLCKRQPKKQHCAQLGEHLAQMHLSCADFKLRLDNKQNPETWRKLTDLCSPKADNVKAGLSSVITNEMDHLMRAWPHDKAQHPTLSHGICHADLFPDNVFFIGDQLSGFIDFYFACNDYHAYDLAICLNSWCFEKDYSFNLTLARALLDGYQKIRPLTQDEKAFFPLFARGAAFRFLMTRLYDWINHPPNALVTPHDPLIFYHYLNFHIHAKSPADYGL
ncbi:MAG: homoserine kinase [Alphaproteobacteria bacterium]